MKSVNLLLIPVVLLLTAMSAFADPTTDLASIQQEYAIHQTQSSAAYLLQQQQAAIALQSREIRALSKQIEELKQAQQQNVAYNPQQQPLQAPQQAQQQQQYIPPQNALQTPVDPNAQARSEYNPNVQTPTTSGDTTLLAPYPQQGTPGTSEVTPVPTPQVQVVPQPTYYAVRQQRPMYMQASYQVPVKYVYAQQPKYVVQYTGNPNFPANGYAYTTANYRPMY